ncbi:ABC transporter ATP-binding protein [Pseudomonas sp. HN2-3]|jgi:NitT/TauT family transport system ATP-binding protein|uniref:ABC transporter ATP-binding protein n=1 Tax=Pseudomonas sp. HN2-3 TaxID=2886360 RepID=UPI001D1078E2|nr:ABC transporter ATP-binding protein [Pseudomonas sp. HN2-3]UDU81217.1 ABC transporter ATP-binding protein [Pseudomonas sp. HN2-3]
MESEPFISFDGVQKRFKVNGNEVVAVHSVSLDIKRGEIVTLVGPAGCGKSVLLNMIAGLYGPSEGVLHYGGAAVKGVNNCVGYMTQTDHLLPWRSVAGNIAAPLEIGLRSQSDIDRRVEELLALVGLSGFGSSYPNELSGGMRKRVAMARLLASEPETLLMDEPFRALDAEMRLPLQAELLRLCKQLKKTVLFVTHDVDEAIGLADRCVVFAGCPGTIDHVMDVPLTQPRNLRQLRGDPHYVELRADLWQRLAPDIAGMTDPASLSR